MSHPCATNQRICETSIQRFRKIFRSGHPPPQEVRDGCFWRSFSLGGLCFLGGSVPAPGGRSPLTEEALSSRSRRRPVWSAGCLQCSQTVFRFLRAGGRTGNRRFWAASRPDPAPGWLGKRSGSTPDPEIIAVRPFPDDTKEGLELTVLRSQGLAGPSLAGNGQTSTISG